VEYRDPSAEQINNGDGLRQSVDLDLFIDVDYTLLSAAGSLRPHARSLFERLTDAGHRVWVWSGVGIRREEMTRHGIDPLVSGYSIKPVEDFVRHLRRFPPPAWPSLVLDDHEDIVRALGGVLVPPYFFEDHRDSALQRACDLLLAYGTHSQLKSPSFYPPPGKA
jgi:hypothetical protein